ncbi:DNA-processing protein DprA [Nocardia sp. 2YAB30]|uniref:DNA-processing protein DprA n=1 Tax=Nocardia sp. 2YAB30 TaxID=3233022 RepID=UPI003F9B771D
MTRSDATHEWDDRPAVEPPMTWDDRDRAALVALMRLKPKNAEWSELTEQVLGRRGARALWDDDHQQGLFGSDAETDILEQAERDVAAWHHTPFGFHTFMDESYPEQLRSVRQMPPVVFTQGKLIHDDVGICVVGSRKVSEPGMRFAQTVAQELAATSVTVVAGLAEGVDTAAHQAALDAGGRTVAVLGNGLNHVYPRSNTKLQAEIAEHGMLLTHFLPEYSPRRWSFPARNVTMSAYSAASVIVEAGERSGTRIQAREAVAHGRPVVLNSTVVQATTWGRDLQDEPGVYVANSPAEAIEHIQTILAHRAKVSIWLN